MIQNGGYKVSVLLWGFTKTSAGVILNMVKYKTIKYRTEQGYYMNRESVNTYVNRYCRLRDKQYAAYEGYARKHGLTTKELFILDIIYFAENGCTQAGICERLSATKQTVSAAIKKFWKSGYIAFEESKIDRRNKIIRFTAAGREYVARIIPPAAQAENDAMEELSDEQQAALVQLTDFFSEQMRLKFEAIQEDSQ